MTVTMQELVQLIGKQAVMIEQLQTQLGEASNAAEHAPSSTENREHSVTWTTPSEAKASN